MTTRKWQHKNHVGRPGRDELGRFLPQPATERLKSHRHIIKEPKMIANGYRAGLPVVNMGRNYRQIIGNEFSAELNPDGTVTLLQQDRDSNESVTFQIPLGVMVYIVGKSRYFMEMGPQDSLMAQAMDRIIESIGMTGEEFSEHEEYVKPRTTGGPYELE